METGTRAGVSSVAMDVAVDTEEGAEAQVKPDCLTSRAAHPPPPLPHQRHLAAMVVHSGGEAIFAFGTTKGEAVAGEGARKSDCGEDVSPP